MSDLFANPTATGLLGGFAVIALQYLWKRVGNGEEKSLPVQLAEINVQLASIQTTLRLIQNDAEHDRRGHEELKSDFWNHMDKHHGWKNSSGPHFLKPAPHTHTHTS